MKNAWSAGLLDAEAARAALFLAGIVLAALLPTLLLLATGIRDGRISPPRQWRLPRRPGSIVILAVFTLVYTVLLTIIAST